MPIRHALPLRFSSSFVAAAIALSLFACSEGEGGACQIDDDCDDGLFCDIAARTERGTCQDTARRGEDEPDAAVDAGPEPQLPEEDAGGGSAPDEDAGS